MSRKIKELDLTANPLQHQQSTVDTIAYPSVRYFQIHFEYMQEQLQRSVKLMENLHQQVLQLEQRLSNSHGINHQISATESADGMNIPANDRYKQISLNNSSRQTETENTGALAVKVKVWRN